MQLANKSSGINFVTVECLLKEELFIAITLSP